MVIHCFRLRLALRVDIVETDLIVSFMRLYPGGVDELWIFQKLDSANASQDPGDILLPALTHIVVPASYSENILGRREGNLRNGLCWWLNKLNVLLDSRTHE